MLALVLDLADLVALEVLDRHVAVDCIRFGLEGIVLLLVLGLALDFGRQKSHGGECEGSGRVHGGDKLSGFRAVTEESWGWSSKGHRHWDGDRFLKEELTKDL